MDQTKCSMTQRHHHNGPQRISFKITLVFLSRTTTKAKKHLGTMKTT